MPKAMPYLSSSSGLIGPTFRPKLSHLARKSGVKVPWSCEVTPVYGACQVGNARYCVRKVPPQVPQLSPSFHGDCYSPVTEIGDGWPERSHFFLWKLGTYAVGGWNSLPGGRGRLPPRWSALPPWRRRRLRKCGAG